MDLTNDKHALTEAAAYASGYMFCILHDQDQKHKSSVSLFRAHKVLAILMAIYYSALQCDLL